MKKINIVKKNLDFKKIIDMNNCVKNRVFLIHYGSNNLEYYRFGISVSKKIGKAVTRNYYKRVIRNIVDNHKKLYSKGKDYIIIMRKGLTLLNFSDANESFIDLIKKINI